ncbi:MAG: hypothetical protein Q7J35_13535 [Candidatus Methanoperedens sp.]|nr:hypothetical protein [Candidatus Methanoperedens sp.]
MYKGQPIGKISDENIKIWRYMKYERFEELLRERTLYFARVDTFDDAFEGWVPGTSPKRHNLFEMYRKHTYANCWNEKDHESYLMWKKYEIDKRIPIVIQSTFKRLVDSLGNSNIDEYIDKVNYIDNDMVLEIEDNIRIPFFLKRKEYDDEHEIRAIIQIMNPESWESYGKGIHIPILLDELIENIYISPIAQKDFIDSVQAIVDKSRLGVHVIESCLSMVRRKIYLPENVKVTSIPNSPLNPDPSGNYNISGNTAYVIDQIPYNNERKVVAFRK